MYIYQVVPNPASQKTEQINLTPARDPKRCGGRKSTPQIRSNISYGTLTNQARHGRNCSSRNLFWHKRQTYVYSSIKDLMPEPQTRTSKRISKDRHRRTLYIEDLTRSSHKNFLWASQNNYNASTNQGACTVLMQGPLEEDLIRISTRSSDNDPDHARTPRGISSGPLQDLFTRASTRSRNASFTISLGSPQDLLARTPPRSRKGHQRIEKTLSKIFMPGPLRISQDCRTRTCCCGRGSYKFLIQEPPKSIPEELSYKHL